jgi:prophage regulatory protein
MHPAQYRIIRANQITQVVGISRRHADRLEADGKFPRKVKLGENSVGWLESEINAWIEARAAERQPVATAAE